MSGVSRTGGGRRAIAIALLCAFGLFVQCSAVTGAIILTARAMAPQSPEAAETEIVAQFVSELTNQGYCPPGTTEPAAAILVLYPYDPDNRPRSGAAVLPGDGNPRGVWWFEKGRTVEVDDPKAAIRQYRGRFVRLYPGVACWSISTITIDGIREGSIIADVYYTHTCSSLCGSGLGETLFRMPWGAWIPIGIRPDWQA